MESKQGVFADRSKSFMQTVGNHGSWLANHKEVFGAAQSFFLISSGNSQEIFANWPDNTHFSIVTGGWQWATDWYLSLCD